MGATMRITWPLLSLCFLFLSICSNTDSQTTSAVKNPVPVTTGPSAMTIGRSGPTVTINKTAAVGGISGVPPSGDVKNIQTTAAPTSTMSAAVVVTTPAVIATSKLPDKPNSAGPHVPTVTNNPPGPPIITSGPHPTTAATAAAPKTMGPVTITVTPNATTEKTMKASATDKPSGTGAPAGNVVTTKIPMVMTVGLTSGQQPGTHTTIATKTSPHSIGGTEKTTIVLPGPTGTTSRATQPAGNTETTNTPSTKETKAGPTAPPSVTAAGTMTPQTPIGTTTTITNTRTTNTRTTNTRTTNTRTTNTTTTSTSTTSSTAAQPKTFLYSLNHGHEKEQEKDLVELCKRLMVNFQDGNCTLTWQRHNLKIHFYSVEINGKVKTSLANQYYEDITKTPTDNKTLIAILASCGALLIMIVILAVCASHHRKPYNDNQQHLTEELHTVENGYHDNPTLEVMEVQPEMQEKKMALNGEFNDSWIVPIDNLLKEDVVDEEDTHL